MTHICVSKLAIIGSDNGLSPGRRQAIIWTIVGILFIGPLRTNSSEIWIRIQTFSLRKMHLKMSSAKRRPFCLGLNVSTEWDWHKVDAMLLMTLFPVSLFNSLSLLTNGKAKFLFFSDLYIYIHIKCEVWWFLCIIIKPCVVGESTKVLYFYWEIYMLSLYQIYFFNERQNFVGFVRYADMPFKFSGFLWLTGLNYCRHVYLSKQQTLNVQFCAMHKLWYYENDVIVKV